MRAQKRLQPLLKYQDLFLVFIWRDFSVRYKQAVLGIAWAVIQPSSMMLLFTFIFTYIMPVEVSHLPRPVFYYSGLLPWTFFSSTINYAIPSLISNYNLLKKIYFPRLLLPLSGMVVASIDFLIAATIFGGLLIVFGIPLSINLLWVFPLFLLLVLFTGALALVLSALNVYYRDVGLASAFFIQLLFFSSPIFYSVDRLPLKLKIVVFFNPLTFIVENMRRCLIEGRQTVWWQYLIMLALLSILAALGYRFFMVMERKFADVI
ncbi:MAG: ABC transporter permease [Candidatus Omnitrophota bacterium]